jgi:hypothetical protein
MNGWTDVSWTTRTNDQWLGDDFALAPAPFDAQAVLLTAGATVDTVLPATLLEISTELLSHGTIVDTSVSAAVLDITAILNPVQVFYDYKVQAPQLLEISASLLSAGTRVDVDIPADSFDIEAVLQEVIYAGWLTREEVHLLSGVRIHVLLDTPVEDPPEQVILKTTVNREVVLYTPIDM